MLYQNQWDTPTHTYTCTKLGTLFPQRNLLSSSAQFRNAVFRIPDISWCRTTVLLKFSLFMQLLCLQAYHISFSIHAFPLATIPKLYDLRPHTAKAIPATPERTIQSLAQSIGLVRCDGRTFSDLPNTLCGSSVTSICHQQTSSLQRHAKNRLVYSGGVQISKRCVPLLQFICNMTSSWQQMKQDTEDCPGHCRWCFRRRLRSQWP